LGMEKIINRFRTTENFGISKYAFTWGASKTLEF